MKSLAKTDILHKALCGILSTTLTGCIFPLGPDPDALKPGADWSGLACDDNSQIDLLSNLNPTQSVDGFLLYSVGGQRGSYIQHAGGEPCANAVDVTGCNQTLDSLPFSIDSNALVITQGDVIQILQNEDDIKSFLGSLDNPQKVFSWIHVHGLALSCNFSDSAVIQNDDGQSWNAVYTEYTQQCAPIVRERVQVNVNVEDWSIAEFARAEISREEGACIGRKPPGSLSFSPAELKPDCNALGVSLARHAAYEAASVVAFEHLKKELEKHNAPRALLNRIESAANDERRHAIQVAALAARYGHQADDFHIEPVSFRDLESIAIDNMQEGCIGETWGALIGLYQAEKAADPAIAETMRSIALEEVEHASLSWAVHDWIVPQLDKKAIDRVNSIKQKSLAKLIEKASVPADQNHVLLAGLPEVAVAKQLADKLVQSLMV